MDLTCTYPPELAPVPTVLWHSHRQEWSAYVRWCEVNDRRPYPPSDETVQAYIRQLGRRHANPSRIWVWRSALDHTTRHRHPGTPSALSRVAARAVDVSTAMCLDNGWRPPRLPQRPPPEVRAVLDACARTPASGIRDGALIGTAFMGYLTPAALAAYRMTDLGLSPSEVRLRRRTSLITLTAQPGDETYCPVALMRHWATELVASGRNTGALFRPVNGKGQPPAISDAPEYRMSPSAILSVIDRAARRSGQKLTPLALRRLYLAWLRDAATDPVALAWMLTAAA